MKTAVEPEAHAAGAVHDADLGSFLPSPQAAMAPQVPLPYHPVHSLQRSLGNQGTQRALTAGMLQPKLRVGAPDDVYEKEADEVAEQVMSLQRWFSAAGVSGSDDDKNNTRSVGGGTASQEFAQRKMLQRIPIRTLQQTLGNRALARLLQRTLPAPVTPELSRKCACGGNGKEECPECRKKSLALQRSAPAGEGVAQEAPPIVDEVLATPGQPLADPIRRTLEPSLGHDFSGVRVHDDSRAAQSASAVSALAYTVGDHIVFAKGQYAPDTSDGKRLLAHELTHVVQQGGLVGRSQASRSVIQRDVGSDDYNQGYQDGKSGADSNAGPRAPDALTDYNEGYAKGHYEFSQQSSTPTPVDQTPAPNQAAAPGACVIREDIPASASGITNSSGQIRQTFQMNIDWMNSPPEARRPGTSYCDCACGEYRQYIKGHLIINGVPTKLKLWGGAVLEDTAYHEDGLDDDPTARYGHRDEPQKMNEAFEPDRATGCSYRGKDAPGVFIGDDIDLLYQFKGQTYDTCNQTFGQIHEWEMRFKGKLNYGP